MSNPYKLLRINQKVFSLAFEHKLVLDYTPVRHYFVDRFPELEELTFTFNRINLFFHKEIEITSLADQLISFSIADYQRKSVREYWKLPICFDPLYTEDLEQHFKGNQRAIHNYQQVFLSTTFILEFYGFLPGFGYMSGLPKKLHLARKSIPNQQTKKGTVAVGGEQLGIYPQDSPGGWQGIGHCPVPWFSPQQLPPIFIQTGDAIRFVEVDYKTCQSISLAVEMNVYQPKKCQND